MLRFTRTRTHSALSDEELLAHYQRTGEARYLGQLYERYLTMVYGVCLHILRNAHAAEDAVMSIYEELTRKARTHPVETFRGWLYVLARNHCLMELRRQKRAPMDYQAPENLARYEAATPADDFELPHPDDGQRLQECLQNLPEKQRFSIQRFYLEDQSYRDIAQEMGEDVGKIRSYIQNGRRNLRLCMEKKLS
ncbi:MAG: sigma-70 family RNA polymerase sigma factor [Saprospiraceae bacterium]|nr:sigma-70 family RNA polymerase sigma factor [Saprospiraceae bacterium]MDW8230171.1 sigma-70 family RNA polymerase sigma factor [Saprospiraceae bacterium]